MPRASLNITLPDWIPALLDACPDCPDDASRLRLTIDLAHRNVLAATGGPFGAAVSDADALRPLAVGVNRVEALNNASLHAEMIALMFAQATVGAYTLRRPQQPARVLYTSCAPCAMCLGAVLWSGVTRLVCGATREDALALGFDEGPVFAASWRYLEARGIEVVQGLCADEARAVFDTYRARCGRIYNA